MTRIARVEIYQAVLPLDEPFRIAVGVVRQIDTVVVRIVDRDGIEGWGEAAPHPQILSSTKETACAALAELAPRLLDKEASCIADIEMVMEASLCGHSEAKAAIDIALHDLFGKRVGLPVWRLLGGARPTGLPTSFSLGIDEPAVVADKAKGKVTAGFRHIKVKVGLEPRHDLAVVRAVRRAIGEAVELTIDANQGWTRPQAVWALDRMAEFDIAYAEQPVVADDVDGMAWVRQRTSIPIMADETVHSPRDAMRVAKQNAADYINIKLMKSGGLWNGVKIAAVAEAASIPCMIGAMSETNLSITAAVHFSMAHANIRFTDLEVGSRGSLRLFTEGGIALEGGRLRLVDPDGPGLGLRNPDRDRIGSPIAVFGNGKG